VHEDTLPAHEPMGRAGSAAGLRPPLGREADPASSLHHLSGTAQDAG